MSSIAIKNLVKAIYESSKDKEGAKLDEIISNSVFLIKKNNLLEKKKEILNKLEDLINIENKIIKTTVTSNKKINKDVEEEIKNFILKKYKANEVILNLKEDKKLLGGIKIEIGNDIIDTSLKAKIEKLQNYLITN